ncbi:23S rRNA (adenine(2503)-C(2))-methyltransferase RlmN [Rhodothermus profundi]|uniref:Probable dual-specificity RNA methyltransferase RlmN n=1 Tax=Rhodothermus profundi TaxID=633813 RepID=A0A1M6WFN4_9BACT|nr:23S rRNA (adenine(2503)-C(2))-methyltransferase RlmN [Rhodothermus profundi]SHK92335.1 23S rRNA m(2)A-2503 methyltransferase [Rhodothermus profundi]
MRTPTPIDLRTLSREELERLAEDLGEPRYRGRQLFKWIYGKGAVSVAQMTDLPKSFRAELARRTCITRLEPVRQLTASDQTIKVLFRLPSGRHIESVLIPDFDETGRVRRLTVCVSSQVGCAMGCAFCATGLMGFQQNLTAGEIYDQVWQLNQLAETRFGRRITNVVYMGMGEPLLNYDAVLRSVALLTDRDGLGLSPRRITVSTVGLARRIRKLADDRVRFRLAVSLHAPTNAQRSAIMPVNRSEQTDLDDLIEAIRYFEQRTGQIITYEYCLFEGFNDRPEDAHRLADLTRRAPGKVNLILYNPVEGLPFCRPSEARLQAFIRVLVARGVTVTVRRSRGQDINAACGQLAIREPTRSEVVS